MNKKIAVATCSGMSPNGLVGRAAVSDMAFEFEDIISICMGATSADNKGFKNIISKYPILAINGCEGECVNKILKQKGVDVVKSINIFEILDDAGLKANDVARLDEEGEKCVKHLKSEIKKTIENL